MNGAEQRPPLAYWCTGSAAGFGRLAGRVAERIGEEVGHVVTHSCSVSKGCASAMPRLVSVARHGSLLEPWGWEEV